MAKQETGRGKTKREINARKNKRHWDGMQGWLMTPMDTQDLN
jgi:hypothetical protein